MKKTFMILMLALTATTATATTGFDWVVQELDHFMEMQITALDNVAPMVLAKTGLAYHCETDDPIQNQLLAEVINPAYEAFTNIELITAQEFEANISQRWLETQPVGCLEFLRLMSGN